MFCASLDVALYQAYVWCGRQTIHVGVVERRSMVVGTSGNIDNGFKNGLKPLTVDFDYKVRQLLALNEKNIFLRNF